VIASNLRMNICNMLLTMTIKFLIVNELMKVNPIFTVLANNKRKKNVFC
jgi:hypothetical protein